MMADKKDVHKGHRQRMREHVNAEGFDAFHPHQVIEVLLFYAIPVKDVSDIAHALIDRFGSVYGVLTASTKELTEIEGVGKRTAEWLNKVGKLICSYGAMQSEDRVRIGNLDSVLKICSKRVKKIKSPCTYHLCMSSVGVIQAFSKISDTLEWGDADVLRYAMEEVLSSHARHVIIVEYTCEAKPTAGEYERKAAESYAYTMSVMGAELLDVVLIGMEDSISLSKEGIFERAKFSQSKTVLSERYLCEDADLFDYEELNEIFGNEFQA